MKTFIFLVCTAWMGIMLGLALKVADEVHDIHILLVLRTHQEAQLQLSQAEHTARGLEGK